MRWNALRGAGSDPLQRSVPLKIDYDHDAELLRLQQLTAQRADQLAAASARPVDEWAWVGWGVRARPGPRAPAAPAPPAPPLNPGASG